MREVARMANSDFNTLTRVLDSRSVDRSASTMRERFSHSSISLLSNYVDNFHTYQTHLYIFLSFNL